MQGDSLPEDLDLGAIIQVPRFGPGQKVFRRYTLQKIIGRGGMGVVWLAHDAYLETAVALKVLPETLVHDSASLDSLKRETKLGLCLAHPHIVRIYDFQNDEAAAAISMEYVDGGNLSDLRVKKPRKIFEARDLTNWIEALFDGLEYAHVRQQIVHRDLKPRNLMLNRRGELKITDFGISRSISDTMTMLTGKLTSTGSPPYVSPQQWDGERPTPLDDIYSLGATLYELLTSKPPLMGVIDWQQVHHKVPPSIWQRRLDLGIEGAEPIPAPWEETVAACLAKDPKDRPQTVRELRARLLPDSRHSVTYSPKEGSADPLLPPSSDTAAAEEQSDDTFERTIKAGATRSGRPEVTKADDEGIFDEPTLRQVRDPVADLPTDDIESGATLPGQTVRSEVSATTAIPRKGVPAGVWLVLIAIGLLGCLAYLVFAPGEAVVRMTGTAAADRKVDIGTSDTAPASDHHISAQPAPRSEAEAETHQLTPSPENSPEQAQVQSAEEPSSTIGTQLTAEPTPDTPQPQAQPQQLGTIRVTTIPAEAIVLLDESPPDKPPDTFSNVPFGEHRLTVSLEGYESIYRELDVRNEETVHEVFELKRTHRWLRQQEFVDDIKKQSSTPDSPQYIRACAKYLLDLYHTDSPPAPELPPEEVKRNLEAAIERLRNYQATLKPSLSKQEFLKYKEAITLAAQSDSLQGILMLAENQTQQHEKFRLFYQAANEKSDPTAMMMLGILYAKGAGDVSGKPNILKALEWLQRAADAGDREAAAYYYDCYLYGDPTTRRSEDEQKAAVEKLRELAEQGVPHAAVVLGQWYRSTARTTTDKAARLQLYRQAAEWWRKAKGPREWRACYYLGTLHEQGLLNNDGKPTRDDRMTAKALYQEGADNEDIVCMFQLGRFMLEHPTTADDRSRAVQLIRDAAAAGSEEAKKRLEQIERDKS
jgi:serine/threonine protein kinase/TPR repeat protein